MRFLKTYEKYFDASEEHDFFEAVAYRQYKEVQNYLEQGQDPNERDDEGQPAIIVACYERNDSKGLLRLLKLLVEYGADVNRSTTFGTTALMVCVSKNYLEAAKYLINQGADVNMEDNVGITALLSVRGYQGIEIVKLLVENGADINHVNDFQQNALLAATDIGVVKYLVEHGINVNQIDQNGENILIKNCVWSDPEIVEYLCEKTDINMIHKSPNYGTIFDVVFTANKIILQKYFKSYKFQKIFMERFPDNADMIVDFVNPEIKKEYADTFEGLRMGLL